MSNILQALSQLDPEQDNLWTADGSPMMDAVKQLAGDETITRAQLINEAPTFSRMNMELPEPYNIRSMAPDDDEIAQAKAMSEIEDAKEKDEEPPVAVGSIQNDDEPPVEEAAPVKVKTRGEAYQEEYDLINVRYAELTSQKDDLEKELKQLARRQAQLSPYVTGSNEYDHRKDMLGRKAYIDGQNKIRMERHEKHGQVLAALGVKTSGASPLDQALSRKTARGMARPAR